MDLLRIPPASLTGARAPTPHLPSLDGLRGLAILLVIIGHGGSVVTPARLQWLLGPAAMTGVSVFFVLSGFLITTLLLDEQTRTGGISLRRFYLRRALRILPASYAYVAIVALLSAFGLIALMRRDIVCALLYVVDYHHDRAWYLGHFWSLSVEEQFYLVWPPALVAVGARRALYVALALFALAELIPVVPMRLLPAWNPDLRLPNGAAPIIIGCLLALRFDRLRQMPVWRSSWWLIAFVGASAVQIYLLGHNRAIHGAQVVINLLIAVVILRSVLVSDDLAGRLLNSRPLSRLGTLSYSLYLWQQLFVAGTDWHGIAFPFDVALAFGAALLSYWLIERPFLRLKRRFAA